MFDISRLHRLVPVNTVFFFCFFFSMTGVLFWAEPARAHKVTIFAWVEGDTVHTQSKFSGGKKAQNATVVVYDTRGNRLLEGKTDKNGEFSFTPPIKTGLKVVLEASMGHAAQWTIPEEEIISALEELIQALQQAQQKLEEQQQQENQMLPGQPQDQALVDQLAEIKMVRALQMRANTRTKRYAALLEDSDDPKGQAVDSDLKDALRKLGEREARIQQITREIVIGKNR